MADLRFHPAADIFPLLYDTELAGLTADIATHGLREPIVLHPDGSILDGRNRYRACQAAQVEPSYETWDGQGSAVEFVISLNLHRRHLNESQRAMVAARVATLEQGARTDLASKEAKSQPEAAEALNVSRASVQRAVEVLAHGAPELITEVEQGRMNVSLGAKIARTPKKTQRRIAKKTKAGTKPSTAVREVKKEELAENPAQSVSGKYRVIYADPPWNYADKCDNGSVQGQGAEAHYPSMSIAELCAVPVKAMADDDAVLFLWVTSPLLFECAPIIDAWGFTYRASFVWDKVKHNMGHYNSVRHELLLVCVRGSCQPDVRKLFDSVVVEERTAHSAKPETFRTIIDTIYPEGKRIELFARGGAVKGWTRWGNQA